MEGKTKTFLPKAASNVADRRFCWEAEDVDLDSDRQKTKLTEYKYSNCCAQHYNDLHFPNPNCSVTFSDQIILPAPLSRVFEAVELQCLLTKAVRFKMMETCYNISITLTSVTPGGECCLSGFDIIKNYEYACRSESKLILDLILFFTVKHNFHEVF